MSLIDWIPGHIVSSAPRKQSRLPIANASANSHVETLEVCAWKTLYSRRGRARLQGFSPYLRPAPAPRAQNVTIDRHCWVL